MFSLRIRATLAGAAVLAAVLPAVASAVSPPLTCRTVRTVGSWQTVNVDAFRPVQGVDSVDRVTSYAVDAPKPGTVVASNGTSLKRSTHSGCDWEDVFSLELQPSADVPLSGQTARIVSTTIVRGRVLAAVREGSAGASRPHVVGSDSGRAGTYQSADSGLPPQGSPTLIRAAGDGRTVYLVLRPVGDSGGPVNPGGLPSLPPVDSPTSGGKAGLLYASTDAGHTWSLRTTPSDLPAGAGLDQLAIDRGNPSLIFATSNGLLYRSRNGGGTFERARVNNEDVTAVETMAPGQVAIFTKSGFALKSRDGGEQFAGGRTIAGIGSAAYRAGDSRLAIEANGQLALVDPASGATFFAGGPPAVRGSLTGDTGAQSTYHGLSGHALLRYVDPPPPRVVDTPVNLDDLGAPPPPQGVISPGSRTVQLKVGTSAVYDYTLALPKSPTPLDLFFLIDTSGSMSSYIDNLKTNIGKVVNSIQSTGINLQVGVGTLGTGGRPGDVVPPTVNPDDPNDRGSKLYELFRRIGPVDTFGPALARVRVKQQGGNNPAEAQLAALEQASIGNGIRDERSPDAAPLFIVQPGQDAGWRRAPGIRRIIVHATDEAFDKPVGSPVRADGELDFARVLREMNATRVQQIGITTGAIESREDLARIAQGTKTLAPPGGADCGEGVILPAGKPLVCDTEGDFSALIARLVNTLQDRASITLSARGSAPKVVGALDASGLRGIDVTKRNTLPFRVAVTCKGSSPGTYNESVAASLRGVRIGTTFLKVECLGPAAAARLLPPIAVALPPAAPPPPPAPAAIVAAPPAAQPQAAPQSQPQAQSQIQPLTAAAAQRQEQLQLALALQAGTERPETETEMAMVGRRHEDDAAAFALLAAAMLASSVVGLARLRHRPEPSVVRSHR